MAMTSLSLYATEATASLPSSVLKRTFSLTCLLIHTVAVPHRKTHRVEHLGNHFTGLCKCWRLILIPCGGAPASGHGLLEVGTKTRRARRPALRCYRRNR